MVESSSGNLRNGRAGKSENIRCRPHARVRFVSRQMKSRCKTLHIDLQLETLALPEKERSEERGALFRPLFN